MQNVIKSFKQENISDYLNSGYHARNIHTYVETYLYTSPEYI